jgi:hypothetical protein
MNKQSIRNYVTLAAATLISPLLLYAIYAIFWPYGARHLATTMLPLAISSVLFLATANLLGYSDLKTPYRCYDYAFNVAAILFPMTSFVIHSNLEQLTATKILYECKMVAGNFALVLIIAEAARRYLMHCEKVEAEADTIASKQDSDK